MKGNHIESDSGSGMPTKNIKIWPEHVGIVLGKPKLT